MTNRVIALVLATILIISALSACQSDIALETPESEEINSPVEHAVPQSYARLDYNEYFSVERSLDYSTGNLDGWAILSDHTATYRVLVSYSLDGAKYDETKRENICEPVKSLVYMLDQYVYCLTFDGNIFRVDQYGNYKETLINIDDPIEVATFEVDLIYFAAANVVYRYHIESGIIDKGCEFEGEIESLWPDSNYVVQINTLNPEYDEYVKETGDTSGDNRYLSITYNFNQ